MAPQSILSTSPSLDADLIAMLSPLHSSISMPSLPFRSMSYLSESAGLGSPPTSPQPSSFPFHSAALLDFPHAIPITTPTTSTASSSSSPSSSPLSLSADDSSDSNSEASFQLARWPPAHGPAFTSSSKLHTAQMPPWHEAVVPLSSVTRLPSPPLSNSSYRSGSVNSSASSVSSSTSSSTPAVTSTPTSIGTAATAAVKKRKRSVAHLTVSERLSRRRAQHRAVDASRRQKEASAISRLLRLIRQQQQSVAGGAGAVGLVGEADDDTVDADEDDLDGSRNKAGRLTVLESSIALIEQLTAACSTMERACNAKDVQVSRVSGQLHSVAALIAQQATELALVEPNKRDGLTILDGGDGSDSAMYRLPTAYTDYSQHYSQHTNFLHQQQQEQQHSWAASRPSLLPGTPHSASTFLSVLPQSTSSYLLQSDMNHTLRTSTVSLMSTMSMTVIALPSKVVIDVNDKFLAMTGHKRADLMYHSLEDVSSTKNVPQYPASVAAVNEVLNGTRRHGTGIWRCVWADGRLYENSVTFYAIFDEPSTAGSGEKCLPDKMLLLSSAEEAVVVDDFNLPL